MALEHGLFKSFDDVVRRQLDAVWHTVSVKTKQVSMLAACLGPEMSAAPEAAHTRSEIMPGTRLHTCCYPEDCISASDAWQANPTSSQATPLTWRVTPH